MPFGAKDPLALERIQAPLSQAVNRYLQGESQKRAFARDLVERDFVAQVMDEYGSPEGRAKKDEYAAATKAISRLSSFGGPRSTLAAQMLAKNLDLYSKLFPEKTPPSVNPEWVSPDGKVKTVKADGVIFKEEVGIDPRTQQRIPGAIKHTKIDDTTSLAGGGGGKVGDKLMRDYFQYKDGKVVGMAVVGPDNKPMAIDANTRNKLIRQAQSERDRALSGMTQAEAARGSVTSQDVEGQARINSLVSAWQSNLDEAKGWMDALIAYSTGDKAPGYLQPASPTPAKKRGPLGARLHNRSQVD